MSRLIKGQVVRHVPGWLKRAKYSTFADIGPVAAKLSYLIIYNGANDGTELEIWDMFVRDVTGAETFPIEYGYGLPAGTSPITVYPGRAGSPAGVATAYTLSPAACIGSHIDEYGLPGSTMRLQPSFPMFTIPPGWWFGWHTGNSNSRMLTSMSWVEVIDTNKH